MPRCGCSNPGVLGCTCELIDSDCMAVSGLGTSASPYNLAPVLSGSANQLLTCGPDGLLATVSEVVVSRKVSSGSTGSLATSSDVALAFGESVWESSPTTLTWSAVTTPSRLIIPAGEDGRYAFAGWASIFASAQGLMRVTLRKTSGATVTLLNERSVIGASGFTMILTVQAVVDFVAGDYCEVVARQESGSSATLFSFGLAGARLTRG